MLRIRATFTGREGSLGFRTKRRYNLDVSSSTIWCPEIQVKCPYDSLAAFLLNWSEIDVLEKRAVSERSPKLFDA